MGKLEMSGAATAGHLQEQKPLASLSSKLDNSQFLRTTSAGLPQRPGLPSCSPAGPWLTLFPLSG